MSSISSSSSSTDNTHQLGAQMLQDTIKMMTSVYEHDMKESSSSSSTTES